jgi:hypothetical protein
MGPRAWPNGACVASRCAQVGARVSLGPKKWILRSTMAAGLAEVTVDGHTTYLTIADITKAVRAFSIDPHALKEGEFELFENLVRAWRLLGSGGLLQTAAETLARCPEVLTEFSALRALGATPRDLTQLLDEAVLRLR